MATPSLGVPCPIMSCSAVPSFGLHVVLLPRFRGVEGKSNSELPVEIELAQKEERCKALEIELAQKEERRKACMPPQHDDWRTLQHKSTHSDILGGLQKKKSGLTYATVATNIKSVLLDVAKAFGRVGNEVFGKLGHTSALGTTA